MELANVFESLRVGKLTSDCEGLRSRSSVGLGSLSEGCALRAVRSVDLDSRISIAKGYSCSESVLTSVVTVVQTVVSLL